MRSSHLGVRQWEDNKKHDQRSFSQNQHPNKQLQSQIYKNDRSSERYNHATTIRKQESDDKASNRILGPYFGDSLQRGTAPSPSEFMQQSRRSSRYWHAIENHRSFFDHQETQQRQQQQIPHFQHFWYQRTIKDLYSRGGSGLLIHYYNNSLRRALETVYPEYTWGEGTQLMSKHSSGYWQAIENQRSFFQNHYQQQHLSTQQITRFQQWWSYQQTIKDIHDHGGGSLLTNYYNNSLSRALETVYPEYNWQLSSETTPSSWHNRNSIDSTTTTTTKFSQGYSNSGSLVQRAMEGDTASAQYTFNKSPLPQQQRRTSPASEYQHWGNTIENHRSFFDNHLNHKLQITYFEQWSQQTINNVKDHGGMGLLTNHYNCSLQRALETIYPEYDWLELAPQKRPPGYWQAIENQRSYFDSNYMVSSSSATLQRRERQQQQQQDTNPSSLSTTLPKKARRSWWWFDIFHYLRRRSQFWYCYCNMKKEQLRDGYDLKSTRDYISILYPEYPFFEEEGQREASWWLTPPPRSQSASLSISSPSSRSPGEQELFRYLDSLHIADDWIFNYKQHPALIHSRTGKQLEFDLFSPSLQLAIEYQGMQHYRTGWRISNSLEEQQMRDQEKRISCAQNSIYLLEIDCRKWEKLDPSGKYSMLRREFQRIGQQILSTTTQQHNQQHNNSLTTTHTSSSSEVVALAWIRALSNMTSNQ